LVTAKGKFHDMEEGFLGHGLRIIIISPPDDMVFCDFTRDWRDRLVTLVPEEEMTIEGEVKAISRWIVLERCRLL